jgi:hypothetical protein
MHDSMKPATTWRGYSEQRSNFESELQRVKLHATDIPMVPWREAVVESDATSLRVTLCREDFPEAAALNLKITWGSTGWEIRIAEEDCKVPAATLVLPDGERLRIDTTSSGDHRPKQTKAALGEAEAQDGFNGALWGAVGLEKGHLQR